MSSYTIYVLEMQAEIQRLSNELAEARDKAAEIVRDEVYAEAHDTEWDTGFNYAKSMAIRALKSPKQPIL